MGNSQSHGRQIQHTLTATKFPLAVFRWELSSGSFLGSKKFYSHEIQASSPCSRNVLQGTKSSSSTLACQKIFQGFSWSELHFRALHSLITGGDLQSPLNSAAWQPVSWTMASAALFRVLQTSAKPITSCSLHCTAPECLFQPSPWETARMVCLFSRLHLLLIHFLISTSCFC